MQEFHKKHKQVKSNDTRQGIIPWSSCIFSTKYKVGMTLESQQIKFILVKY